MGKRTRRRRSSRWTSTSVMVEASLRGVDSHGIAMVATFAERIRSGVMEKVAAKRRAAEDQGKAPAAKSEAGAKKAAAS